MRLLLSYIMSHMYDIHAFIAGTVVVTAMMYIKGPIKKKNIATVDKVIEKRPKNETQRIIAIRRRNFVLIVLVFLLSILTFGVLALISPFISFSWQSSMMTGVFALCIYAFKEQVFEKEEKAEWGTER